MNFNKKNFRNLFIIIVCVFVIIPVILLLFDINPFENNIEGMDDNSYVPPNPQNDKMDRINVNGVTFDDNDKIRSGFDKSTAATGHLYCPGGDISLNLGDDEIDKFDLSLNETGTYSNGKTYNEYSAYAKWNVPHLIPYNIDNSVNYDTNFCNVENQPKTLDECQAAVNKIDTDMSVNEVPDFARSTNPSGCFKRPNPNPALTEEVYRFNPSPSNDVNPDFSIKFNRICKAGGLANNDFKKKYVYCNNNLGTSDTNALLLNTGESGADNDYRSQYEFPEFGGTNGGGTHKDPLSGFIGPFESVPMDISDSLLTLYLDPSDGVAFTNYDISSSSCFIYDTNANCSLYSNVYGYSDSSNPNDSDVSDSDPATCPGPNDIKCVADNGSKQGDPLCCGQTGIVQNTNHLCPSEYPKCVGYECGKSWGKCVKE